MLITGSCKEGVLTLNFDGELDHHAAEESVTAMEERLNAFLPRSCVLNFRDLTFMDSSGIALILRAERRMKELDGTLTVRQLDGQPERVLRAAGLLRFCESGI